jgi:Domain of unknown function (DUF4136)
MKAIAIAAMSMTATAVIVSISPAVAAPETGNQTAASSYVTYFVLDENSSASASIDQLIEEEVATALADKGLVRTAPDEAEAVVVIHVATPVRNSIAAFYEGWGGWEWRAQPLSTPTARDRYKAGALVVDVFDAWTKQLIWRGSADDAVPSDATRGAGNSNLHAVKRAIARIFKSFPAARAQTFAQAPTGSAPVVTADEMMRIIFSTQPAILIHVDGEPKYGNVSGTGLRQIVNTKALILRDDSGMLYLRLGDRWMEAYELTGPWSVAGSVPDGADLALEHARRAHAADPAASVDDRSALLVYVSQTPAELVVTDGEPQFVSYRGTPLLYVTNTAATVFKESTDKEIYVRAPSGWFRAWTTNGPWQLVPDDNLPSAVARAWKSSGAHSSLSDLSVVRVF